DGIRSFHVTGVQTCALPISRFSPKLRAYLYLNSLLILLVSFIGIPLIPIWLVVGWIWSGRYFRSLRCEVDGRHLRVWRGVLFRRSKERRVGKEGRARGSTAH